MISPRRNLDFALMRVSNNSKDTDFNYLDLPEKRFIFSNYKTAGTYNTVTESIPDDLLSVIKVYLRSHPFIAKMKNKSFNFPFLVNHDGKPIDTSDKLTKTFHRIFGKKISSSLLRNIYLTDKYSGVVDELKKDTKAMSTSVGVALNNYIKE